MSNKVIEFIYDKTLKRPKNCRTILLYYKRMRLQPGEFKKVDMTIRLPKQIITAGTLLPSFNKNGLKLENC